MRILSTYFSLSLHFSVKIISLSSLFLINWTNRNKHLIYIALFLLASDKTNCSSLFFYRVLKWVRVENATNSEKQGVKVLPYWTVLSGCLGKAVGDKVESAEKQICSWNRTNYEVVIEYLCAEQSHSSEKKKQYFGNFVC